MGNCQETRRVRICYPGLSRPDEAIGLDVLGYVD